MPKVKKPNNAKPASKPKTRKRGSVLHCADPDSLELSLTVYAKSIVSGKIKVCLASAGDTNIVHMQGDDFDHLKVGQNITITFN